MCQPGPLRCQYAAVDKRGRWSRSLAEGHEEAAGAGSTGVKMTKKIVLMIVLLSTTSLTVVSTGVRSEEPGETVFKKNCAICTYS